MIERIRLRGTESPVRFGVLPPREQRREIVLRGGYTGVAVIEPITTRRRRKKLELPDEALKLNRADVKRLVVSIENANAQVSPMILGDDQGQRFFREIRCRQPAHIQV